MRFFSFILVPVLSIALVSAHAVGLPDTGLDLCDNGANVLTACTSANTGSAATYPKQDGRFGRDAAAANGVLVKTGAGAAGFDYTKVANNGSDLLSGAPFGPNPVDWACTRDNVTGLTWEVKTASATDLRYWGHAYGWHSTDSSTNGGNPGNTPLVPNSCNGTLPSNLCDTQAFITAVNTPPGLCGQTDWRLPSIRELATLLHLGTLASPSIDVTYFPNTPDDDPGSFFWSSTSYAPTPGAALLVDFKVPDATFKIFAKVRSFSVRLVRGAPF